MRQSAEGVLVTVFVGVLEVVPGITRIVFVLDDLSLDNAFGYGEHLVILETGEDLIRYTVLQPHEGNPLLFVILEADHVGLKHLGPDGRPVRFLIFLTVRYQHPGSRTVAVNRCSLASFLPCGEIELRYKLFLCIGTEG